MDAFARAIQLHLSDMFLKRFIYHFIFLMRLIKHQIKQVKRKEKGGIHACMPDLSFIPQSDDTTHKAQQKLCKTAENDKGFI